MKGPLTEAQVESFRRDGYVVVSGLIEPAVVAKADDAMWKLVEADPDRPETWRRSDTCELRHIDEAVFMDCYSDAHLAAAEQLGGRAASKPASTGALNAFPTGRAWGITGCHIDHAVEAWKLKTFPRAFSVASLIYLNDVESQGGGTAVWPGSHLKLAERAHANPDKYEFLYPILADIESGVIDDLGDPILLPAKAGDILFFDWLFGHSGTTNVDRRPRFALHWNFDGEQAETPEWAEIRRQAEAKAKVKHGQVVGVIS